jgi:RHS repeat-associated protein
MNVLLHGTRCFVLALLAAACSLTPSLVYAANESYSGQAISGTALTVGAQATSEDPKFGQLAVGTFAVANSTGDIRLRVREEDAIYHAAKYIVKVSLSIEFWSSPTASTTVNTELTVEYDPAPGKKHQDMNVYRAVGAQKVIATITAITAVDESGTALAGGVPADVALDVVIDVERYYKFLPSAQPQVQSVTSTTAGIDRGTVEIAWSPVRGAEEYDLEWSIVGAEDGSGGLIEAQNLTYDFRHNASRITTSATRYTLNRIFEKSWVVFRIRAVGRDASNLAQRIEGEWSLLPARAMVSSAVAAKHAFSGGFHEPALNWRYTASFAEEGKRKEVVEYYDGTLRKRQAVTLLSTANRTVVAESVPDNAGRMAVEMLPAPTTESIFHFYRDFNRSTASGMPVYSRSDFDVGVGECAHPAEPVAEASGAGQYYSSSNPDLTGMNAFIPHAKGYPFVQTSFTRDNTGRIQSQGGAGIDHRLTSGHETRYFYGTAIQEDLDRLFGGEVGYSVHYKKNMTVDPNGQASIAYLDPAGRTIATSLAGDAPPGMQKLESNTGGESRTLDLMGTNEVKQLESRALNTHLVTGSKVLHEFTYRLEPPTYVDACAPSECYDCVYDLIVSVQNECGIEMITDGPLEEAIGAPVDSLCESGEVERRFKMPLSLGSHPIAKTLRLNEPAIDLYIESFIAANTCLKTFDDFLAEITAGIDYSGCGGDVCEAECADELASVAPGTPTPTKAECVADCETIDPCRAGYDLMLADMRPKGQYATHHDNGDGTFGDLLSVFNAKNNLRGQAPLASNPGMSLGDYSWQHPNPLYHDEDGNPSMVLNHQGVLLPPEKLSLVEFLDHWEDSWAESLVAYHPEYCFYQWCVENKPSNDVDSRLWNTETCTAATAAGLLPNPVASDPYFGPGGMGISQEIAMQQELTSYAGSLYSMKEMSLLQVHCVECDATTDAQNKACLATHTFGVNPLTCDDEWTAFRDLYLTTKQAMVEAQRDKKLRAVASDCSPWKNVIGRLGGLVGTLQQNAALFDKNSDARFLFWSKKPRYQSAVEMISGGTFGAAAAQAAAADSLDKTCRRTCESYADAWMEKLAGCRSLSGWLDDSLSIRTDLIEVCRKGCDECSMFGASTTKPGTTANSPHNEDSFDDVLRRYLGNGYASALCNAGLITMPMPYGHNYLGIAPGADDCGCPPPTGGSRCLTCETAKAAFDSAKRLAPRVDRESNASYLERVSAELNRSLAFNLTWVEYADFLKECDSTSKAGTLPCPEDRIDEKGPVLGEAGTRSNSSSQRPLPIGGDTWKKSIAVQPGGRYLFSAEIELPAGSQAGAAPVRLSIDGKPVELRLTEPARRGERAGLEGVWQSGERDSVLVLLSRDRALMNFRVRVTNLALRPLDCTRKLCNTNIFDMPEPPDPCRTMLEAQAFIDAEQAYAGYVDSIKSDFRRRYVSACMKLEDRETFTMKAVVNEYHFTLYFYDQAGNLTQTVPPAGVVPLTKASEFAWAAAYRRKEEATGPKLKHRMPTRYTYNSLNQLTSQSTPDAGTTRFWYDNLGRLAISQSARQQDLKAYNYTKCDGLGRIEEVGQIVPDTEPALTTTKSDAALSAWIAGGARTEITRTHYDRSLPDVDGWFGGSGQKNVRGKVASATYLEADDVYQSGTHYSYDIHGNVESLIQENREMPQGHERKRIDYEFDLVSGNIKTVDYQTGSADQFHHVYRYDSDNRIIEVSTSPDGVIWDRDARYLYYLHGPLGRLELGAANVQGLDYAYTIQGWLKGANSGTLRPDRDMGSDGVDGGVRGLFGRDEIGYTLSYFNDDYLAIGGANFEATSAGSGLEFGGASLYNGNIRHMVTAIGSFMGADGRPQGTAYRYDELNRLVEMSAYKNLSPVSNSWEATGRTADYHTELTYDPNGNTLTQRRWGTGSSVDDLTYSYLEGSNQLDHVADVVPKGNYSDDIDNQDAANYRYDASGNLIMDSQEKIEVAWTGYAKVDNVNGPAGRIDMQYDVRGNRVAKAFGGDSTRFLVSDVDGNIMATYIGNGESFYLESQPLFGNARIGEYRRYVDLGMPQNAYTFGRVRNERLFEIANSQRHVLSVVGDRLIPIGTLGSLAIDTRVADVVAARDYYPYGAPMPARSSPSSPNYRYGFNGMETDSDIQTGEGVYIADYRVLDSRLGGRWWSPDPIVKSWESPYAGLSNNPIYFMDPVGLDPTSPNQMPQSGEQGELWTHTDQDGTKWNYMYEEGIGWVGVGATASLPAFEVVAQSGGTAGSTTRNAIYAELDPAALAWGWTGVAFDVARNTLVTEYMYKSSKGVRQSVFATKYGAGRSASSIGNIANYSKNARAAIKLAQGMRLMGNVFVVGGVVLDLTKLGVAYGTRDPKANLVLRKCALNIAFAGVGYVPVVGWVVAGTYFVVDATVGWDAIMEEWVIGVNRQAELPGTVLEIGRPKY